MSCLRRGRRKIEKNSRRETVISMRELKAVLNKRIMDEDIESECSSSNLFSVAHIRENRFSRDTHRSRKSPHKKLKIGRTSTSLVIDQLKSVFRRPGDFTPRMRTRRNWRPEFLMKYFRDNNRCVCKEECTVMLQDDKRSFVPEAPRIYSIGLHSGARNLNDSDDLSRSCGAIRNFKKRLSIVRRSTMKYWVTQSIPNLSLKTSTNRQTMAVDCTEMTDISKHDRNQHDNNHRPYEEKNGTSISLQDDFITGNRSFIPNDFKDSARKDHECRRFYATRDAQIQTSSRKSSRRRKRRRSKPTSEGISHRKRCDDERIIADSHVGSQNSTRGDYREDSKLCVRFLKSKCAEYIDKFTAVNRQIEEITATLRETCYSGANSPGNLGNCEEYLSSIFNDAKVNTERESDDIDSKSTIARRGNTSREKDLINVRRIVRESASARAKTVQEILHINNINNETSDSPCKRYPKDIIVSPMNLDKNLNDTFVRDPVRVSTRETIRPSNKIFRDKEGAQRCGKQISFDLDLTKNDDELQIDESYDEVHLRNPFNIVISGDKYAKDLIEDFAEKSKESKYCKTVEEKVGEKAILEDIKKRIDRDFDDRTAGKSENGTEDFLTVSRKSSNLGRRSCEINPHASVEKIEKFTSTPLIVFGSPKLGSTETQIRDSISAVSATSSNKNSTLSKYFSCMQFPISLTENEDKIPIEDRGVIAHSHSNSHSNSDNYYDCSHANLDSSFERAHSDTDYIAQYDPTANKFLIETIDEARDTFEIFEDRGVVENKICERKRFFGDVKREEEESRVELEKRYTADSTLETSKSSRYIGSIDSGVFSSSLIDLYPTESSFDAGKSELKKKRRAGKFGSSPTVDFSSDGSYTDDTLDQRINDVVRDLTKNLIFCERRARTKLKEMRKSAFKARDSQHALSRTCTCCDFFISPRRFSEDERILSISTPSLLSLSDSEIEDRELRCRRFS